MPDPSDLPARTQPTLKQREAISATLNRMYGPLPNTTAPRTPT